MNSRSRNTYQRFRPPQRSGRSSFTRGRGRARDNYGTEQDPVNCAFFLRTGACRHGEHCPKKHDWPSFSATVLFIHLWVPSKKILKSKKATAAHYEDFVEDVLEEMLKYGPVEEILTYQNRGDHLLGNTFVRFPDEDMAQQAITACNGRYYAGRRVEARFSPVQDFENSSCRDHQMGSCKRGHFCNFAHFQTLPSYVTNLLSRPDHHQKFRRLKKQKKALEKNDGWPAFPVDGTARERRKCLEKWNKLRIETLGEEATLKFPEITIKGESGLKLFKP